MTRRWSQQQKYLNLCSTTRIFKNLLVINGTKSSFANESSLLHFLLVIIFVYNNSCRNCFANVFHRLFDIPYTSTHLSGRANRRAGRKLGVISWKKRQACNNIWFLVVFTFKSTKSWQSRRKKGIENILPIAIAHN